MTPLMSMFSVVGQAALADPLLPEERACDTEPPDIASTRVHLLLYLGVLWTNCSAVGSPGLGIFWRRRAEKYKSDIKKEKLR